MSVQFPVSSSQLLSDITYRRDQSPDFPCHNVAGIVIGKLLET